MSFVRLQLRLKSASVSYDSDQFSSVIDLECSPLQSAGALEIDAKHVFASRSNRRLLSGRRSCRLSIRVVRKSDLTPEALQEIGLSKSKIGKLTFFTPQKGEGWFSRPLPAFLQGIVYLSDELHGRMLDALLAGRRPTWFNLEIEGADTLQYGPEPDGSRMVWKIESTTKWPAVDVRGIDFGTDLFGWRYFVARIVDRAPGPLLWVAIGFLALIAWNWMTRLLSGR